MTDCVRRMNVLYVKARAIEAGARAEGRALSDQEDAEIDRLVSEFDRLAAEHERIRVDAVRRSRS